MYRNLEPDRIPKKIRIFTADIDPNLTFGESMSEPARDAASRLTQMIVLKIERTA